MSSLPPPAALSAHQTPLQQEYSAFTILSIVLAYRGWFYFFLTKIISVKNFDDSQNSNTVDPLLFITLHTYKVTSAYLRSFFSAIF